MFIQLCLLAAGVYYGRHYIDPASKPAREAGRQPPGAGEGANAEPAKEPDAAVRRAEERAEIEASYINSLACMGIATAARLFAPRLQVLSGVLVLYSGIPAFRRAKELLFDEHRVGAEVLDTVSVVATVAAGHYVSASFISFVYSSSRVLRLRSERVVEGQLAEAFVRHAEHVWVVRGDVEVNVSLASLEVGDVVVIEAGASIPADGVVVEGCCLVDQHILTGESVPVKREIGDRVYAATMVSFGRVRVCVETTGEETVAAEIEGALARTAEFTGNLEAEGQKIADELALPTLALSVLANPVVGTSGSVALFSSSFLDNMRLFIPFSMLNFLGEALAEGILIKDGRSLEVLPKVDTFVFDKTGTLTDTQLEVIGVHSIGGCDEDEILCLAAAIEMHQVHPLARAIVDEAARRGLEVPRVEAIEVELGLGLTASWRDSTIRVGSLRFLTKRGVIVDRAIDQKMQGLATSVYVARDAELLGTIEIEPQLHPEALEVIAALRARGVSLHTISGDREGPTRALSEALGFDSYRAGMLPDAKAAFIDELQAAGKTVCFVGDGINDCLALSRAAVSMTTSHASPQAVHRAQIILEDLGSLPAVLDMADAYHHNISNIKLTLGIPSAVGIGAVLFAGAGVPAMTTLYGASMFAALGVAVWPHRQGGWSRILGSLARSDAVRGSGGNANPVEIQTTQAQEADEVAGPTRVAEDVVDA